MVLMVWKRRCCFLEGSRVKVFCEMRLPTHLFIGSYGGIPGGEGWPNKSVISPQLMQPPRVEKPTIVGLLITLYRDAFPKSHWVGPEGGRNGVAPLQRVTPTYHRHPVTAADLTHARKGIAPDALFDFALAKERLRQKILCFGSDAALKSRGNLCFFEDVGVEGFFAF
jgi:hypothetical protein